MSDNNSRPSSFWPMIIGMVLVALVLFQFKSLASLRSKVADLEQQLGKPAAKPKSIIQRATRPDRSTTITVAADNGDLASRLLSLEESVVSLNKNAKHLMDRGQVPPDSEKAEEWKAKFLATTNPDRSMFGTLRLLRSNNLFDDAMATHAATLMMNSTNFGTVRAMVESLRGAKNLALKPAFLALAADSKDSRTRWNAVNNLREFAADDAEVEQALWDIATKDSSREIRGRAEDALRRVPLTEARQNDLAAKVTNTGLDFDERWSAFRVLGYSKNADVSEIALNLVQSANAATQKEDTLQYIRAFDDVNNSEFMMPLVNFVQSTDAEIRLKATDALVDYKDKDPNVLEWLKVLAKEDPDERVRKEAARAFQRSRGRR
ncbi:MAG: HEAT repeat domain-containing protein [Limisphaerales bacterium]